MVVHSCESSDSASSPRIDSMAARSDEDAIAICPAPFSGETCSIRPPRWARQPAGVKHWHQAPVFPTAGGRETLASGTGVSGVGAGGVARPAPEDALVAHPAGDAAGVERLEERLGVLARDGEPVAELRERDAPGLAG